MCYCDLHGIPKRRGSPWFATVCFVAIHNNNSFEYKQAKNTKKETVKVLKNAQL